MSVKILLALAAGYYVLIVGCLFLSLGVLMFRVRRMKASRGKIRVFLRQLTFPLDWIYVHPRRNFFIANKGISMDAYLKQNSIIAMVVCLVFGSGVSGLIMYIYISSVLFASDTGTFVLSIIFLVIGSITVLRTLFFGHRLGKNP